METIKLNNFEAIDALEEKVSSSDQFIQANTKPVSLQHLKNDCIIPVFAKDNESTISHNQFIDVVQEAVQDTFANEAILDPAIRISHPIKGRTPEAVDKPVNMLTEDEKTVYYERMAFMIEIPTIHDTVSGNKLSLSLGGVRAYNQENLYSKRTFEKFKFFIGFKNHVCTNLCISTDGLLDEIKVASRTDLYSKVQKVINHFNGMELLKQYDNFQNYSLTEKQFAQLVGRARMYHFLPQETAKNIDPFPLIDTQVSMMTKAFFKDKNFKGTEGEIDLWRLYNLFTGANKSSYIDAFLKRGVGSFDFIQHLMGSLEGEQSWYLS